jgi:hypothetical protein
MNASLLPRLSRARPSEWQLALSGRAGAAGFLFSGLVCEANRLLAKEEIADTPEGTMSSSVVERHRAEILALAMRHGARNVRVFGSLAQLAARTTFSRRPGEVGLESEDRSLYHPPPLV